MEKKTSVGVTIALSLIGLIFIPFIFAEIINTTANKQALSEIITADFIKKVEKGIGYKIEYIPDYSNDYGNCGGESDTGRCAYAFMERGKSGKEFPAMLSFKIFKATDVNIAKESFNSERRIWVGWKITDKGDIPLPDEGYDLNIVGYEQVRKYDYGRRGRRGRILARINNWFFELDYAKKINDNKIIAILEELGNKISFTKVKE